MAGINTIQTRKFGKYNLPFNYDNILSGQMGRLIPVQCDEVNAGEYWDEKIDFVMRMSPLIHPAMTQLDVHFYSFFVPTRVITPRNSVQSTWEKLIESINQPSDEQPILPSLYTAGRVELTDDVKAELLSKFGVGSLSDYLDFLTFTEEDFENNYLFHIPLKERISLHGFLVYLYIYNWWFRRDQIEDEILMPLSVGAIDIFRLNESQFELNEEWNDENDFAAWLDKLFTLRYKNYERDYFTSALKKPQYGEDVSVGDGNLSFDYLLNPFIPVSGNATLTPSGIGSYDTILASYNGNYVPYSYTLENSTMSPDGRLLSLGSRVGDNDVGITPTDSGGLAVNANVIIDQLRGTANTFTINELRLAMQMQAVCETINRGGTRYVEIMENVYGSVVPDARLQQPVFLGGQKFPVTIGTVVQTSQTSDSSTLGTLAGKAQAANGGKLFRSKKKFDEAGYVMTIMCVCPRSGYAQGLPRKWMKKDVLDFFNPYFAHIGEQEVYNAELYYNPIVSDDTPSTNYDTFGWQERYSEYRHPLSRIHGEMRTTKKDWHLYRYFDEIPSLSADFIKMDVSDFTRIFEYEEIKDTQNEMFDMMLRFTIKKKTPVPKYGTPYSFI